mgnify:CR=1 FL=1
MSIFTSHTVTGEGKGTKIGFPTINIVIPDNFSLKQGVWGCDVEILGKKFDGILYYGPKKNVDNMRETLEVHIFETIPPIEPHTEISIKTGLFIRKPQKIEHDKELQEVIQKDINILTGSLGENLLKSAT